MHTLANNIKCQFDSTNIEILVVSYLYEKKKYSDINN